MLPEHNLSPYLPKKLASFHEPNELQVKQIIFFIAPERGQ